MRIRTMALAVFCVLGAFNLAFAHEFIVKPDAAAAAKGESVGVQVQAAHVFMVSEEAESVRDVKLQMRQGETVTDVALSPEGTYLFGTATLAKDGPALLSATRLPQLWSDTTEGVLAGDRAALEAQGKKVLSVGRYEKFAKALINAAAADTLYKEALGQPLEIILLDNPANIRPGDAIRCRVLYRGKPLAATVSAVYDGYSKDADVYASETKTDANGEAAIVMTKPGLWMLRAAMTGPVADGGADKADMRATYVFAIQ